MWSVLVLLVLQSLNVTACIGDYYVYTYNLTNITVFFNNGRYYAAEAINLKGCIYIPNGKPREKVRRSFKSIRCTQCIHLYARVGCQGPKAEAPIGYDASFIYDEVSSFHPCTWKPANKEVLPKLSSYRLYNFTAYRHLIGEFTTLDKCRNLEGYANNQLESINPNRNCVRLFDGKNCTGNMLELTGTSLYHWDLKKYNFENKASSIGPCPFSKYLWTNFTLRLDASYRDVDKLMIEHAVSVLEPILPCVTFKVLQPHEKNLPPAYIQAINDLTGKCASYVGKLGGRQNIFLASPTCMTYHTIPHELLHALGLFHEQKRPDRDDYVRIKWDNVNSASSYNYRKKDINDASTLGVPYDYYSIMHYNGRQGSINGKSTMIAKQGLFGQLGSNRRLRNSDIRKLRAMYAC